MQNVWQFFAQTLTISATFLIKVGKHCEDLLIPDAIVAGTSQETSDSTTGCDLHGGEDKWRRDDYDEEQRLLAAG
jgi:hypothetical protein